MKLYRIFDPAVVRVPAVHMLSLSAMGIPANAGKRSPDARRLSIRSASARALSAVTIRKARTSLSTDSMRLSAARVSLHALKSRRFE